jgi:hypothetical protein
VTVCLLPGTEVAFEKDGPRSQKRPADVIGAGRYLPWASPKFKLRMNVQLLRVPCGKLCHDRIDVDVRHRRAEAGIAVVEAAFVDPKNSEVSNFAQTSRDQCAYARSKTNSRSRASSSITELRFRSGTTRSYPAPTKPSATACATAF